MIKNLTIDFIIINNQQGVGFLGLKERLNHQLSSVLISEYFIPRSIMIRIFQSQINPLMKYFILSVKQFNTFKYFQYITNILNINIYLIHYIEKIIKLKNDITNPFILATIYINHNKKYDST